jgi:hypothetical protein
LEYPGFEGIIMGIRVYFESGAKNVRPISLLYAALKMILLSKVV